MESSVSTNTKHRLEQTAGIIIGKAGPRLTKTFRGGLDWSRVDWDKTDLKPGEYILGTVHNHIGGGAGGEHFSEGDITFGRDVLSQLKAQNAVHKLGVHVYMVRAQDMGGGILDFDVRGKQIIEVR